MNCLRLERSDDGLAIIRLDDKSDKINKVSTAMLTELSQLLSEIENDGRVLGLILFSDKPDSFVVGADLKELAQVSQPGVAAEWIGQVHAIFNRIENLACPVLAAIHGHCLGGGLELALACHYRIATDHPKTLLGQPEVKLGLIPAGGGCQRLTRLLGVRRALPLLLQGHSLNAVQAKRSGLVDLVVYPHHLLETAKRYLLSGDRVRRQASDYPPFPSLDWSLQRIPLARTFFFKQTRQQVLDKTHGNYPAPLRVLECVQTGLEKGVAEGFAAEAKAFDDMVLSAESLALRQLFFDTKAMKKQPAAEHARPVKRVGILGAGLMGSGIAAVTVQAGVPVVLKDVSWKAVGKGLKNIWKHFDRQVKKHRKRAVERDQAMSMVVSAKGYEHFADIDLVIEAVFEDLSVKHQVLQEVEQQVSAECILASNTSAIPITEIASVAAHPERVIGMHYFSPVPRMPLLEVVVTAETPDWVTGTAIALGQRQGKTVIVVKDGPGFYTSRILAPFIQEAAVLLQEGADVAAIDQALEDFGFPVGPCKLLDEVGIDVAAHVARDLQKFFESRGFPLQAGLQDLVEAGYLGRKNAQGFYRYALPWWQETWRVPGVRTKRPVNEEVYRFFGGSERKNLDRAEMQERLALMMVNEAVLCLAEGIIASPRDGDVGAVLGLGFPPFLGGPFRYLEKIGLEEAVRKLQRWTERVGPRFQPATLLKEMADKGELFYPG